MSRLCEHTDEKMKRRRITNFYSDMDIDMMRYTPISLNY
jgi:hypothetical protein